VSAVFDELEPAATPTLTGAWAGVIASNPGDVGEQLDVTIPAVDPQLKFGPCRWQSRDATSLPVKGDECLVVFDNNQSPWVAIWWPFA
jgi:hypothetical protein